MGVRKVDILTVELGLHLDEAGFRHAAAALGDRLGRSESPRASPEMT